MKKISKVFIIAAIMITFMFNLSLVFAAPENNQTNTNNTAATAQSTTNTETNNTDKKSNTQVTSVATVEENKLKITDILNILLIATGIVIILLAIAIFIKLK